jgi:electron transport complex protein RnfG
MSSVAESGYRKSVGYQAGLLGAFTMLAAVFLVMGNIATRDAIEQRRAEDLSASLGQVIPSDIHDNDLLDNALTVKDQAGAPVTLYRALHGLNVTAVALQVTGQGYGGPIQLILGIGADGKILGTRALSHTETPGLGDKIEATRDDWIFQFNGRSLGDPPPERWAVKKDGGGFDQLTGATITPRAVVKAIKGGLELFESNRDAFLASAVVRQAQD